MNHEKRIDTIFNNLVDCKSMSKEMPKSIKPVGTRPGTMYGLCKVHKQECYIPQLKVSTQLRTRFILLKIFVSKTLHYLWVV